MTHNRLVAVDCGDCIIVNDKELYQKSLKTFLVALPWHSSVKGYACQTVLVNALDESHARTVALRVKPSFSCTGDVKEVFY